ncbi:MAG: SusC/RagA family TonB-linked outer membrane protein [Cyclobacteriaceae bacterium]|nr:SusC/RagA family TonB-linked outer membrane protein [Cyclobacteriaceae bacterium]
MKRCLLIVFLMIGCGVLVWAQRTVNGKVTSGEDGTVIPGVNIVVVGTQQGAITDMDGNYSLEVPEGASLKFSFIGYVDQQITVGNRSVIDVVLEVDVTELQEVVVTALGVDRAVQALGYSVTNVSGENLTEAREINLGNALLGRVAGVNITSPSSGPAGATRILIRGNKSLNGENQPLIVVDGVPMDNSNFGQAGIWGGRDEGDGLSSISPDDIESITVLKGANASALYGSRGGNGVINVTTKRGAKRKGVGIEFNSNYVFEKMYDQTDLQTVYGSGGYVNGVSQKPGTSGQAFGWGRNSWGPKLDGSSVIQFDGESRPYSYTGNNFEKFFETGHSVSNTLSLSGGGEQQTFRFSATDLRNTAIVPNSGYERTNLTLSTNSKYFDKLTLDAKIMYSNEQAKNRPRLSDSPSNATQSIWYIPNNVEVMSYYGPEDKPGSIPEGLDPAMYVIYGQGGDPRIPGMEWLPASNNWGQNPYWSTYTEINDDTRDRIIGTTSLHFEITDWLFASGRIGMDWATRRDVSLTPEGTGYQLGGSRQEGEDRNREINLDWMIGADKTFGEIGVNAFVGGNKMSQYWEYIAAQGNGFNVQFFPAISNTASRNFSYDYSERGINSLFGSAEVNYNGLVYLTVTARNDWFSVLNPDQNSILYPSIGASWIFSDTFTGLPSWLSFGKLRASWAQVGIVTINPYQTNFEYGLRGESHLGHPMASISGAFGFASTLPNQFINPALSTEIEAGLDIRVLEGRAGLDITYYDQQTTDDIVQQSISLTSGFGATRINIGKITNKGLELLLTGKPVEEPLDWEVSFNVSYNKNEVVSLVEGINAIVGEEPRTRNVVIMHIVGEPYGTITGRVQATDPSGNLVYDNEGCAVPNSAFVPIGYGVHPWSGGINNALGFKNFRLEFLVDFKRGGDIFSGTNLRMTQNGKTQQSLIGRAGEEPLHIKGVENTGTEDEPVWTPVDRDLTPDEARIYWSRLGDQSRGISDYWIYDGSFLKLRQLVLGYRFPGSLLQNTPIQNLNLSFVGRNLWVISKHIDNVDPESGYSTNGGAQGLEYFALPAVRSFGFNVRIGF